MKIGSSDVARLVVFLIVYLVAMYVIVVRVVLHFMHMSLCFVMRAAGVVVYYLPVCFTHCVLKRKRRLVDFKGLCWHM